MVRTASMAEKITCGVGGHPSPDVQRLQSSGPSTEDIIRQVKVPLLFMPGWNDPSWIKENGSHMKIIQENNPGSKSITFPTMAHGWIVRGNIRDGKIKTQVDRAMNEMLQFYAGYLGGDVPTSSRL